MNTTGRMTVTEALAYIDKGYHRMWRAEEVGCHYTNTSYPGAVISTYHEAPSGKSGYIAARHRHVLGTAATFTEAVALITKDGAV